MIAKQSGTFWYSDRRLISGLFLADFKLWHIGEHVLDNLVWAVDTVTLILNRLHGGIYIGLTLMLTHVGLRMCGATGPKLYFHCKVTFLNNLDITQHCNAGKSTTFIYLTLLFISTGFHWKTDSISFLNRLILKGCSVHRSLQQITSSLVVNDASYIE